MSTPLDLKPLTALRFAAAIWVVCFHYWPSLTPDVPTLVLKGYLGVEMFFVLSGFILSHVYLTSFGEGRFQYGPFLWARIARVYPLHLVTLIGVGILAVAAGAAGIVMENQIAHWPSLPANVLMLHAWGFASEAGWNHPSWSISAEWFAYLLFPAFAWCTWRLRNRPNMAVIGAIILIFGLYAVFLRLAGFPLTQATIAWGALRIVPCFAYGCAVWLLWRSGAIDTKGAALFWTGVFGVLWMTLGHLAAPDAASVTVFGGVILALASLSSTGSRVLSGRVGVYLGEISYAVYMVCFPWKLVFENAAQKVFGFADGAMPLWLWAVMFAGVVPAAAVLHHLVERPARRILRDFADKRFNTRLGKPLTA